MATVFTWLMVCNVCILQSERGGGGLISETKLPMQELELKMQGGGGGGIIVRFCGIIIISYSHCLHNIYCIPELKEKYFQEKLSSSTT